MDFSFFKDIYNKHKKAFKIGILIVIVLLILSVVRFVWINLPDPEAEQEVDPIDLVELTSEQQEIISKYDENTKKVQSILINNTYMDVKKTCNLTFNTKQLIERKAEEESIKSYAICSCEKEQTKEQTSFEETYKLTLLTGDKKYQQLELHIRYASSTNAAGIETIYLIGNNIFNYADDYERVQRAENLTIENWDKNAEQLIDGKYNELNKCIKDYLYFYYPSVSQVSWLGSACIFYSSHKVSYNFQITLTSNSQAYLVVEYNKDTGTFQAGKTTSADQMYIKKSGQSS